jgi:FkbM family methyltransferase
MLEGSIRSRTIKLHRTLGDLRSRATLIGLPAALKLSPKVSRLWTLATRRRLVTLELKGFRGELRFRPGTSDKEVVEQVFLGDEFSWLGRLDRVSTIVDCGANIGVTAFMLLNAFPNARLVALEPDAGNYEILRKNLEQFGERALALNAAVWSHDTTLRVVRGEFLDGREWTYQAKEDPDSSLDAVPAKSILTVLEDLGGDSIDLLKVDIEGGELALFARRPQSWLPRVKNISIELHGDECTEAFFNAMSGYDFDLIRQGELTVCLGVAARSSDAGSGNGSS